ncbi:uncharacterized protein LOC132630024 isoform X1 [Lycium barbarum]|uniref:uncharacterized protein LOC132630024 isoform X1 n=1 Tax=Lycium barbarum TaxID=112863 RepID=UPI00293E19D5|nr:uncharacterized protein LOC132630024 isoform X1 [Lycium barbarum]XP_060201501.1 uncharacterized protein LOC132630024 isoform X1 [Lycium barbarum]
MVSSSSSSTTPCLRVRIPATGEGKLMINVKSPTSEMYAEVKEADKVKDLEKLIKKAWGDDYMALYYNSIKLKSDMFLSSYNLRDGSIVRVSVLAEPPHHHQSKSSCETKKNAKLQLETSSSNSNGGSGCGSIVFHMAKMLSQFCSSIFSSH